MGTTRVGRRTTADFIALAEEISGQQLDELFQTWLFTDTKPRPPAGVTAGASRCRRGARGCSTRTSSGSWRPVSG